MTPHGGCVLHLSVNVERDEGCKGQPGSGFQELNARRHFSSLIHSHVHGSLEWGTKMTLGIIEEGVTGQGDRLGGASVERDEVEQDATTFLV